MLRVVRGAVVRASASARQAKRPMTLVDLLNIPRVGDPQISPDGRAITFMLSTPDWPANRRVAHLWRINTDGTGLRRLSSEPGPPPSARWSPDSSTIAFLSGGSVFVMPADGRSRRGRYRSEPASRDIAWHPERRVHLFSRRRSADRCRARAAAPARRRRRARRNAAAALVEDGGRRRGGDPRDERDRLRLRVQDRGQRRPHHHQPPPDPAAGRLRQDGAVEHRRRRLRADPADEERRPRRGRRARAGRVAGAVHRARQSPPGAVLQREPVSRSRERAARPAR